MTTNRWNMLVARLDSCVSGIICSSAQRHKLTLALYASLMVASIFAAVFCLGVDTDSRKMLAADLSFQQKNSRFNENFPTIKNGLIIVVRSPVADAADAAADAIAQALQESDAIGAVFSPSTATFFRQNGLLYKDLETLERELDQLNQSASLLASLRQQPSFENFFHSLFTAEELAEQASFDRAFLDQFYAALIL